MRAVWFDVPYDWRDAPPVVSLGTMLRRKDPRLLLVDLWDWAGRRLEKRLCPGPCAEAAVEAGAGWRGRRGAFVEAALATGWLAREGDGLRVVDWRKVLVTTGYGTAEVDADTVEAVRAKERAKKAAQRKAKKAGDKPGTSQGQGGDKAGDTKGTSRGHEGDTGDVLPLSAPATPARDTHTNTNTDTGSIKDPPAAAAAPPSADPRANTAEHAEDAAPGKPPRKPRPPRKTTPEQDEAIRAAKLRWGARYTAGSGKPQGPDGWDWNAALNTRFRDEWLTRGGLDGGTDRLMRALEGALADDFWRTSAPIDLLASAKVTKFLGGPSSAPRPPSHAPAKQPDLPRTENPGAVLADLKARGLLPVFDRPPTGPPATREEREARSQELQRQAQRLREQAPEVAP